MSSEGDERTIVTQIRMPRAGAMPWRLVAFLAIPLAVLLAVRSDLSQAGMLDPFIYLGYGADYGDLVTRFGRTYYSTRLVHILPNAWAASLLGDAPGYYVVRYALLVAATAAIHRIARHYTGEWQAWFVTIFFSTHVWFLREVFWDYYDGTVVVWALVSIACLLPHKRELAWHVAAGFAAALAANGNPVGLVVIIAYGPAWLIERYGKTWRDLGRSFGAAVAGFAACYGLLIVAMTILNPAVGWRFDEITYGMLSSMFSGTATDYFKSLGTIFLELGLYQSLIFPFFVAISLAGILASHRAGSAARRSALGAALFVLGLTLFFAFFHFALHWGLLALHYYLIYFLPAGVVAIACLLGQREFTTTRPFGLFLIFAFFVLHFAFWRWAYQYNLIAQSGQTTLLIRLAVPLAIVSFVSVGLFVAMAARPRWTPLQALVLAIALLSSNAFFDQGTFTSLWGTSERHDFEWDVRDGALYLRRFIAKDVPSGTPINFWYGTRDNQLRSINYTYLGAGRVSDMSGAGAQMPTIDAAVKDKLTTSKYIAVLGNEVEIEGGISALKAAGLSFDIVSQGEFKGRSWAGYRVILLRRVGQ
jgi:hypothetical protein